MFYTVCLFLLWVHVAFFTLTFIIRWSLYIDREVTPNRNKNVKKD
jgi:hypothetical protein